MTKSGPFSFDGIILNYSLTSLIVMDMQENTVPRRQHEFLPDRVNVKSIIIRQQRQL